MPSVLMSSSSKSEADPILVSYRDSIVRSSNLETLNNSNWLDDNIITFAFEYLQYDSKFTKNEKDLFVFVSPPVVQLLKMSDDLFAQQLLQSIDFLEKKFLILPLNDNTQVATFAGTHWSLLILSVEEKILYHFDSMSLANDRTAKKLQKKFQGFFHEDVPLITSRCPQQENGFDCGLYVIVIVEEFCRFIYDYPLAKQSNEEKYDKKYFDKFMDEIDRSVTSEYINQRRKELKTLLESISVERKK